MIIEFSFIRHLAEQCYVSLEGAGTKALKVKPRRVFGIGCHLH